MFILMPPETETQLAEPTVNEAIAEAEAEGFKGIREGRYRDVESECTLTHRFGPGVYLRTVFMPAGSYIIGHEHKTSHWNVVLRGEAIVVVNGVRGVIKARDVILSEAGVRKVLHIIEDMEWMTIHPTNETDLEKLQVELINFSPVKAQHIKEMQILQLENND